MRLSGRARRRGAVCAILATAAALSACGGDRVWMRSGSSLSDAEFEEMNCTEQAEKSGVSLSIGGDAGPATDRFSNRSACLRSRGFRLKSLTNEEAARLKALGGEDREAYWNELLVKQGLSPAKAVAEPASAHEIRNPSPESRAKMQ